MKQTKLEQALEVLGWQGGTHSQVNSEFNKFFKTSIDINLMSQIELENMLNLYIEIKNFSKCIKVPK